MLDVCFEMLEHKKPPSFKKKPKPQTNFIQTLAILIPWELSSPAGWHGILQILVLKKKNLPIDTPYIKGEEIIENFLGGACEGACCLALWQTLKGWANAIYQSTYLQFCKWVSLSLGPSLHGKELREGKNHQ